MKVTILGAGAWGTALAKLLYDSKASVTLWGHSAERLAELRSGQNERYLPGIELPRDWTIEPEIHRAVEGSEAVIMAVPSKAVRSVARRLPHFGGIAISVTKGLEYNTGLTMCGVLRDAMPCAQAAALSGPTFAIEVVKGVPTAIVAASADLEVARAVQSLFHRPRFRVYTSEDLLGVELGGALKNVVAIGAGVCDGIGFGDNSKAALITRAIAEIRRLGVACGAQAETFAGLSGLGDLTLTCFSRLSRNRALGERLGRGEKLENILAQKTYLAEGYPTARSAFQLAQNRGIDTPIINQVYRMLYEGVDVAQAIHDLTSRDSKAED